MVLQGRKDFALPSLISAAYDSYLPAFAQLIPSLIAAYDQTPASNPLKNRLAGQIGLLRGWDYRWGAASMPTSLAVFWGEALWDQVDASIRGARRPDIDFLEKRTTPEQKLRALAAASERLERDFGSWGVAWGDINRFQRLTGDLVQPFDDARASIPVPFTSGVWGSLASFGAKPANGSKRYYGTNGNSFVAAVEFGDKVRARAVSAGGESGDPNSPHFNDQAERYALGNLREVYFYPSQLKGHTKRSGLIGPASNPSAAHPRLHFPDQRVGRERLREQRHILRKRIVFGRIISRGEKDAQLRPLLGGLARQIDPGHPARHPDVGDEHPHLRMRVEQRHRLFGIGRLEHLQAGFLQPVAIVDTDQLLILDDEDGVIGGSSIRARIHPPHLGPWSVSRQDGIALSDQKGSRSMSGASHRPTGSHSFGKCSGAHPAPPP